jgi:hypothetical protein
MHEGSCLCGAVVFEVTGTFPPPDACHRSQYRKHSGHYFAASDVPRSASTIHGGENVTGFASSALRRASHHRWSAAADAQDALNGRIASVVLRVPAAVSRREIGATVSGHARRWSMPRPRLTPASYQRNASRAQGVKH